MSAEIAELRAEVAALTERVAELMERLGAVWVCLGGDEYVGQFGQFAGDAGSDQ